MGALPAREGCCAVRAPLPERFVVHKLLTSRLRKGRDAKAAKDVTQAAVLFAVLAETHSGALRAAVHATPTRARRHLKAARERIATLLADHPRALAELVV